jgi:hypothetical protein
MRASLPKLRRHRHHPHPIHQIFLAMDTKREPAREAPLDPWEGQRSDRSLPGARVPRIRCWMKAKPVERARIRASFACGKSLKQSRDRVSSTALPCRCTASAIPQPAGLMDDDARSTFYRCSLNGWFFATSNAHYTAPSFLPPPLPLGLCIPTPHSLPPSSPQRWKKRNVSHGGPERSGTPRSAGPHRRDGRGAMISNQYNMPLRGDRFAAGAIAFPLTVFRDAFRLISRDDFLD